MYKKILIGIDGSTHSMRVIQAALEYAKKDGAKIVAFHSVLHHLAELNMGFTPSSVGNPAATFSLHQDYIDEGKSILETAKNTFKKENQELETKIIFDIPPEDYVKKAVKEEGFDLVILGSGGKHNIIERRILGTVPEHVLDAAPCDVLVIR